MRDGEECRFDHDETREVGEIEVKLEENDYEQLKKKKIEDDDQCEFNATACWQIFSEANEIADSHDESGGSEKIAFNYTRSQTKFEKSKQ